MVLASGVRITRLVSIAFATSLTFLTFLSVGAWAAPASQPTSDLCGTTILTDVELDHDLVCARGGGIVVGANGITVSLKGHSITGPSRGLPFRGISVAGRSDVTIEGPGTVTNFRTGILITGSQDVLVRKVTFADNGAAAFGDGDGIRILLSTRVTIEKCNVLGNGNDGIQVTSSTDVLLIKNDVSASRNGINLTAVGNQLEKNKISLNTCGVKGSAVGNLLTKNHFTANTADFCA
jgi:parallel beta-helix repeat protein